MTTEWYKLSVEQALSEVGVTTEEGLTSAEAQRRLAQYGPNELQEKPGRSRLEIIWEQFANILTVLLILAAVVSMVLGDWIEAVAILVIVILNGVLGYTQEYRAEQSMAALKKMSVPIVRVRRDGRLAEISARELVPGDVVVLETGNILPADGRVIQSVNLRVEEAALTGESAPVGKHVEQVEPNAALADRRCMAYSGTSITSGSGRGVVVATGEDSEVGRIGLLVQGTQQLSTPLTQRLDRLARQITAFTLVVGVAVFAASYLLDRLSALDSFLAVVGLAVAAIPEGLPAVITIILAIASRSMAQQRAIVRRLPAVETLGSVSVICSDKTGTLTRNEVTAVHLMLPDADIEVTGAGYAPEGGFRDGDEPVAITENSAAMDVIGSAALCNDAALHHGSGPEAEWTISGDPTEGALATLAAKAGVDMRNLHAEFPRRDEIPFESQQRFMATLHHDHHGGAFVVVKGAPERVAALCRDTETGWLTRAENAARHGQRVLAVARAPVPASMTDLSAEAFPADLTLLGMVGMMDPPRTEATASISDCHRAGISVKMITGDHLSTAEAVGRSLNLDVGGGGLEGSAISEMADSQVLEALHDTDVIARANPENKIRLVQLLQSEGQFVAMTGDGANDAPALKAADIGVAMGQRGTDAAREASDLVLTDDNFRTIRDAVREGRVVYDNIKKSLLFILPTNGGEALLILVALLAGWTLPVTVTQILWVNMVTAVTLALALAFEPGEPAVMDQPPRPAQEALLTRPLLTRIVFVSLLMLVVTLAVFEWELRQGSSLETARTAAVSVLVAAEIAYLYQARHYTKSALATETVSGNRAALVVTGLLIVLQLLFVYFGPMQSVFDTTPLSAVSWLMIVALAAVVFFAVEVEKAIWRWRGVRRF